MPRSRKGHGPDSAPPARPVAGPWQDGPNLHIYTTCWREGVSLRAVFYHKPYRRDQLLYVVWRPGQVTENLMLEWTWRGVTKLLADRAGVPPAEWLKRQYSRYE